MKTLQEPVSSRVQRGASLPRVASAPARPASRAPKPTPHPARHWLMGAALPLCLCLVFISVHLTGLALLNWESARRAWLEKEAQRIQQQNEVLRARLNAISAEPLVRRWAEAQGMVRAETQAVQTIQLRQAASSKWQIARNE
ncbi:hypothetical protein HRbin15_01925 [bacterium HR15]|nr:hypothetical protein HRbin15_01925 [bacterium HR15]